MLRKSHYLQNSSGGKINSLSLLFSPIARVVLGHRIGALWPTTALRSLPRQHSQLPTGVLGLSVGDILEFRAFRPFLAPFRLGILIVWPLMARSRVFSSIRQLEASKTKHPDLGVQGALAVPLAFTKILFQTARYLQDLIFNFIK